MTDASKSVREFPTCSECGCADDKVCAYDGHSMHHHVEDCHVALKASLATLTRQRDGLKEALTLADKIICTCGYAGRPELRNGIRAAHTVISVALGKELPLHMIEEAELVKKDVLDDWPGTKGDK